MKHDTGGPAFPQDILGEQCHGMTLRDYFAAKALQGMLANQHQFQAGDSAMFARDAYEIADAMIAERRK
jgi:hypothetical protein